jgi:hypothetical protein
MTVLVSFNRLANKSCVGLKEINIMVKMGKDVALRKMGDHISSHICSKQKIVVGKLLNNSHF